MKPNLKYVSLFALSATLTACNGDAGGSRSAGVTSSLTAAPANTAAPSLLPVDPAAPAVAGAAEPSKPCSVKSERPEADDDEDEADDDEDEADGDDAEDRDDERADRTRDEDDDSVDKSRGGEDDDDGDDEDDDGEDDERPAPCAPPVNTPPPATEPPIR